mmetsp:Transcript_18312/g.35977  ORF Transcript_18312/g.35977 Transcript_18312/m.35977 type:complete len:221 (+) Transcript_18312:988-1650(+)
MKLAPSGPSSFPAKLINLRARFALSPLAIALAPLEPMQFSRRFKYSRVSLSFKSVPMIWAPISPISLLKRLRCLMPFKLSERFRIPSAPISFASMARIRRPGLFAKPLARMHAPCEPNAFPYKVNDTILLFCARACDNSCASFSHKQSPWSLSFFNVVLLWTAFINSLMSKATARSNSIEISASPLHIFTRALLNFVASSSPFIIFTMAFLCLSERVSLG